jgi:hypothetical protein
VRRLCCCSSARCCRRAILGFGRLDTDRHGTVFVDRDNQDLAAIQGDLAITSNREPLAGAAELSGALGEGLTRRGWCDPAIAMPVKTRAKAMPTMLSRRKWSR